MARQFVAPGIISVAAAGVAVDTYSFAYDDPTLYAFDYALETYVATRATKASAGLQINGQAASVIVTDSAGNVGPGSLVFCDVNSFVTGNTYTDIYVWDVAGDTIYTYSTTGDIAATCPIYSGGFLYWFEIDTTPDGGTGSFDVSMLKANCDLTSVGTVQTYTFNHDGSAVANEIDAYGLAGTSGLAWVSSTNEVRMIRFPFSGAAATSRDDSADTYVPSVATGFVFVPGLADGSGNCLLGGGVVGSDTPLLYKQADNDSTQLAALWPTWTNYQKRSGAYLCGSLSSDGTTYQLSGIRDGSGDVYTVQDAASGTADSSPNLGFDQQDSFPTPPGFVGELAFYYGS